jgi:hypothetical protein
MFEFAQVASASVEEITYLGIALNLWAISPASPGAPVMPGHTAANVS